MRQAIHAIAVASLFAVAACSPPEPEGAADGTWVGTITTEGNVTTVVNESGSVWGGTARLVEGVRTLEGNDLDPDSRSAEPQRRVHSRV